MVYHKSHNFLWWFYLLSLTVSFLQVGQQRKKRRRGWEACPGWKPWSRRRTTDFTATGVIVVSATRAWMNITPSLKRTLSVLSKLPGHWRFFLSVHKRDGIKWNGIRNTSTDAKSPNCWSTRLAKTFRLCHWREHNLLTKLLSSASGLRSVSSTWAFSGILNIDN